MDVILLERITRLGNMGETVSVKPGYARNFLIPQSKALPATAANMERYETRRKDLEATSNKMKKEAEVNAAKLDGVSVKIARQSSETGQLFGSVKARDIEVALLEQGVTVPRSVIQIGEPIKEVGDFTVRVALHPEVVIKLPVQVGRQSA